MALKYFLEYKDVENIDHRLEIYDDLFVGSATEISGNVIYEMASSESVLEPIKGQGLRVELHADSTLTFSDLFTEEERSFKTTYKRDSVTKFNGWLNSEGWFEDYVTDNWVVSFDCVDGLSFLEGLSYVDENGLFYTTNQSCLEIISNCLKRTGIEQNINSDIKIIYTGLSESVNVLENVFLNPDRFVKDDGETIMSCKEVLESTLILFRACITSLNGEWFIYKPNQLFNSSTLTYYRYDFEGLALAPATDTLDISVSIGSHVDSYAIHHAGGNQSIRNKKSLGAYRINYKYGIVASLLENPFLQHVASLIDGWTITNDDSNFNLGSPAGVELFFNGSTTVLYLTSDVVTIALNERVSYRLKFELITFTPGTFAIYQPADFNYKLKLVGTGTYYFDGVNWTTTDTMLSVRQIGGLGTITSTTINLPPATIAGDISVEIHRATQTGDSTGTLHLQEFALFPTDSSANAVQGEFHTVQRTTKPSSKIDDVEEVFNGDTPSDLYIGTIYKSDGTTPTESWSRHGLTENIVILRLMGEETLRMFANTAREFSGSVYGYLEPLSLITINNITGKFLPVEYVNDTKGNLISLKLFQIFGDELVDIDYEMTFDYGETVKPTIVG